MPAALVLQYLILLSALRRRIRTSVGKAASGAEFEIKNGVLVRYNGTGDEVTIPDIVGAIGKGAFSGCSNLRKINFPKALTSIGEDAFRGCRGVESVQLPASVSFIGKGAFVGCISLRRLIMPSRAMYNLSKIFEDGAASGIEVVIIFAEI